MTHIKHHLENDGKVLHCPYDILKSLGGLTFVGFYLILRWKTIKTSFLNLALNIKLLDWL